jgi:hypothetical protein
LSFGRLAERHFLDHADGRNIVRRFGSNNHPVTSAAT